jgi:small subunit ribosomal protein S5
MEDPIIPTENVPEVAVETPAVSDAPAQNTRPQSRDTRGDARGGRKSNRRGPRRDTRTKPEFDQKIVSLRRVTRVTSGGRRFAFSVCVVAGNHKGSVGVGQGKAGDTPLAIEKAFRDAKKNMITVNTTKGMSVPHDVEAKFSASRVIIRPAPGKGILAGSSVRTVLELAGMREVSAKLLSRSKNSVNNAKAAVSALAQLDRTKIRHSK